MTIPSLQHLDDDDDDVAPTPRNCHRNHDDRHQQSNIARRISTSNTATTTMLSSPPIVSTIRIINTEEGASNSADAAQQFRRIDGRPDGGEALHEKGDKSNNNNNTNDNNNKKKNNLSNFERNVYTKIDDDKDNNYDGHDSHTGTKSNPIIILDSTKLPSGAHRTTISARSKAVSSNTSSTSGFGDDMLLQLYRGDSDCLESLADDRVLLSQMNNNATEGDANSAAAAARMICGSKFGRASDSVESNSNSNSMNDAGDNELEESEPVAFVRYDTTCTGNDASATLPCPMRSLRSRNNFEPDKSTGRRVGPKFHLLGELKSDIRQQHVVMKGTWWTTEKKRDQKFELISSRIFRERDNISELPTEGEFLGFCKCIKWDEYEKDVKIRFVNVKSDDEKKKKNINVYNITGTGTNSTGIFHLEGTAASTEEDGSYTLKMSKWYVELYYSCTSAPTQYLPILATAKSDSIKKIPRSTKVNLTEPNKKIPKKRQDSRGNKVSRNKKIASGMVGRCVVNNRTTNALDRCKKYIRPNDNKEMQRHQQRESIELQQPQQQQDVHLLAGMTNTTRKNIAIPVDSGVLSPQPQPKQHTRHRFQPQPNVVVTMPSASQEHVPKQQQHGQQIYHHRQVRDKITFRKRSYEEHSEQLVRRHPDRYIHDPSRFALETVVEASTDQRPKNHAIKTNTGRKNYVGFCKHLLKNKQGQEQCFEEARAKTGSYTLLMGLSNNVRVCKVDQNSQMYEDGDEEAYIMNVFMPDSLSRSMQGSALSRSTNTTKVAKASTTKQKKAALARAEMSMTDSLPRSVQGSALSRSTNTTKVAKVAKASATKQKKAALARAEISMTDSLPRSVQGSALSRSTNTTKVAKASTTKQKEAALARAGISMSNSVSKSVQGSALSRSTNTTKVAKTSLSDPVDLSRLFTPAKATKRKYWDYVKLVAGDEHENPTTLRHGVSFVCTICEQKKRNFYPGSNSQVKRHVESEEHLNALQLIHGNRLKSKASTTKQKKAALARAGISMSNSVSRSVQGSALSRTKNTTKVAKASTTKQKKATLARAEMTVAATAAAAEAEKKMKTKIGEKKRKRDELVQPNDDVNDDVFDAAISETKSDEVDVTVLANKSSTTNTNNQHLLHYLRNNTTHVSATTMKGVVQSSNDGTINVATTAAKTRKEQQVGIAAKYDNNSTCPTKIDAVDHPIHDGNNNATTTTSSWCNNDNTKDRNMNDNDDDDDDEYDYTYILSDKNITV